MSQGENKPWDARLVEWMSRGSSEAGGGRHRMTPLQRTIYAVIWTSYLIIEVATGHQPLWLVAVYLAIGVVALFGPRIYERKRRS